MKLQGSFTALATPFTSKGFLAEKAYRNLVRRQLRAGTSGLVPCGSTGEAATLTNEEYCLAVRIVVETSKGKLPVFAGVGSNDTAKAVAIAVKAKKLGADGLLVLAPYYNKPTQEGIYRHFRTIAKSVSLPIIAYNIPGRTGVNILPETLARIAHSCKNVVAVKEASGSTDQVSETLRIAPRGFTVLSGDDSMTLPMMAVGAKGVISVVANIAPRLTAELCRLALQGNMNRARKLHLKMFPLVKSLFVETNPIPLKAALEMMGLIRGEPRLPLTPLTPSLKPRLKRELTKLGLL